MFKISKNQKKMKNYKYKLKSKLTTTTTTIGPQVKYYTEGRVNSLFNNLLLFTLSNFWVRSVHTGSSSVIPVKSYANADILKKEIIQDNKGKAGIYR